MNKEDKHFIEGYEKLLNKGYCNCNEMNCIDNNSPRRILNIVKQQEQENNQLKEQRQELRSWLEDEIIDSKAGGSQYYWFGRVLSKLNELEGGKNE